MYAKRGGSRGGFRGGYTKKPFNKKRPSPDDDEPAPREHATKRARNDVDETFKPQLDTDDDKNPFVALKANGTRRVTISDFKGKTLVSIREYYEDDSGNMRPGKKGISLSIEQYNALLAALPLLESVLIEREDKTVRPNYDGASAQPDDNDDDDEDDDDDVGPQGGVRDEDEDEEDEE
ncbi:hypothetical protein N0V90_002157 [Kalmusia sp. IMI 367209]|nr:hypothetical protein N0V90_002157 [Kalmusia sp. IMI 367209]